MFRIQFINRSYWPDVEATGQLLTELCEDLASEFEVTVVAGHPNHDPEQTNYRRRGRQQHNRVHIHRAWHTRFSKHRLAGRLANYVTFLVSAFTKALFRRRSDIVIVETDPPLLCLLGWAISRVHRSKFVVYLQDIHPDIGIALGKLPNSRLIRLLRRMLVWSYKQADHVVVLSNDMRSAMLRAGLPGERISVIHNWADTSKIASWSTHNRFRESLNVADELVVMYSGNLGLCQGLDRILDAVELLVDRREIRFVFVGDGVARKVLEDRARIHKLTNVTFLDYQPRERLSESLGAADVHLLPLDPRVSELLMPSKLYGVLASGTPAIVVADERTELARIVEEEEVGFVVPPNDPEALAEKISWVADWCPDLVEMGLRARRLAESRFDRKHSVQQFSHLFHAVAAGELPSDVASSSERTEPVLLEKR